MRSRRWPAVRLILLGILLVCIAEYLIATVSVQMLQIPIRTDFPSYYCAGKLAASGASP
jgi:hypothetical protein